MALTHEQINLVKSTAPIIQNHGETVTKAFYQNLIAAHPELRNYFSLRNQQTGAQQTALAKAVLAYATHIDDLGRLSHTVERIAHKHTSLFIKPEHYPIVGEYLIGAFGEVLGDGLTPEVKEAWDAAYEQLANIFVQREKQLYETTSEWKDWRKFRIAQKEPENEGVTSFYLEPNDGLPLPLFLPGQYISLQIPIPQIEGWYQSRQFSLSEAPKDGMRRYRVSVKREETVETPTLEDLKEGKVPGLISNMLHRDYNVGDEVELSAPRGDFFVDPQDADATRKSLVLISAGVGATPLVSILDAVLSSGTTSSRPIRWIHTARHSGNSCFTQHVRRQASKHDNLSTAVFLKETRPNDQAGIEHDFTGRMTTERLQQEALLPLDDGDAEYYICGPEEWMVELRNWLESKGVERRRIHLELFSTGDIE